MKLSAHRIPTVALLAAASTCLAPAFTPMGNPVFAQTMPGAWRCGNSYSDRPCEGGKALALDDARSNAQKRDADAATRRTQAAADQMEKERLRQERAAAGRQVTYIPKTPAHPEATTTQAALARADVSRRKKNRREPEHFTAAAPAGEKKK